MKKNYPDPFFYLTIHDRPQPKRPLEVRDAFPSLGVIPILSPVENREDILTDSYVRESIESRISSRHFRNQLRILKQSDKDGWNEYLDLVREWCPEVTIRDIRENFGTQSPEMDVFYEEPGRRAMKELVWAGDGIQTWLQLLYHIHRLRDTDVIILDEPELYLHPDLQHRLVRLLESIPGQTIAATHSTEILSEVDRQQIIFVEKGRVKSVRGPTDSQLGEMSSALGSQFNLRLAKALKCKFVLCVEGKDMKLLSILAKTLGADTLADENGVAIIPLGGFGNWEKLEPFKWLLNEFLIFLSRFW